MMNRIFAIFARIGGEKLRLPGVRAILLLAFAATLTSGVAWAANISSNTNRYGTTTVSASDYYFFTAANLTLEGKDARNFNLSGYIGSVANGIISTGYVGWADSIFSSLPGLATITGGTRSTSSTTLDERDNAKLIRFKGAGAGLSLKGLRFDTLTVNYTYSLSSAGGDVNGFIGSDHIVSSYIAMKDIENNIFNKINVTMTGVSDLNYLAGGGVIGLRSTANSASIESITGNVFNDVAVTTTGTTNDSAYIEGGGIIGVDAVSSPANNPGHALINNLTYNYFTNVKVDTGDILLGGGLVGLNNNSQRNDADTYVELTNAIGNIFGNGNNGDIKVNIGYSLRGGGIIGLNGLSNAKADLKTLSGNVFAGINVNAGTYIRGGGVVGININDAEKEKPDFTGGIDAPTVAATLETASGNLFYNINVKSGAEPNHISSTGADIDGGGIIGVRANMGIASLGTLANNVFQKLRVDTTSGDLIGGGIVGVSAANWAGLSQATGNTFDDIAVTVTNQSHNATLTGGGIIGVSAVKSENGIDAIIGNVQNNQFRDITIAADHLEGGGYIGAVTTGGFAGANIISGDKLYGTQKVTVKGDLTGGGFAGFVARSTNPAQGDAFINTVSGNELYWMKVSAENIIGGGLIGTVANGYSYINTISGNTFMGAEITAAEHIDGGGIIGVTSKSTSVSPYRYAGIGLIENSQFYGNLITANSGSIMGGLVYSYGLADNMTIRDSGFWGNMFIASSGTVYGTITVDTGGSIPSRVAHTLTLTATAGKWNYFDENVIIDGTNVLRNNSLYFGGVKDTNGDIDAPKAHAELIIDAKTGGVVYLGDPIKVDQSDSKTHGFNMTVKGSGGQFWWGGKNEFTISDDVSVQKYKSVTLEDGSYTRLIGGWKMNYDPANYDTYDTFSLDAPDFSFNLNSGAKMRVEGSNTMTLNNAKLKGEIEFDLGGTQWMNQSDYLTNPNLYTLLTIKTAGVTDIDGAAVSLFDFEKEPVFPDHANNMFPLLDAGGDNELVGNPVNNTAYARGVGFVTGYQFKVDKFGPLGNNQSRYLFAYQPVQEAAREARILTEGRAASLGFLRAAWLPDHSYQQADLALYLDGTYKSWVPFAGIDGALMKVDTRGGGEYKLSSATGLLGIARERKKPGESFLTGIFAEGGKGKYDTDNRIWHDPYHLDIAGDGDLRYVGGGIMARREWSNGVRLEGSFRAGEIKNEFRSDEYVDPVTRQSVNYNVSVPYYAAHVGLARTWALSERKRFDLMGRYFWTRQGDVDAVLPNGEVVNFDTDDSHRVRLGGRMTFIRDDRREWYLGAAGEYEFAGESRAWANGYPLDAPDLGGFTGIGEIGWIYRSTKDDNFSLETGLQGYIGRMRGITGGIRMEWRF
jgi:hypothetical protein